MSSILIRKAESTDIHKQKKVTWVKAKVMDTKDLLEPAEARRRPWRILRESLNFVWLQSMSWSWALSHLHLRIYFCCLSHPHHRTWVEQTLEANTSGKIQIHWLGNEGSPGSWTRRSCLPQLSAVSSTSTNEWVQKCSSLSWGCSLLPLFPLQGQFIHSPFPREPRAESKPTHGTPTHQKWTEHLY